MIRCFINFIFITSAQSEGVSKCTRKFRNYSLTLDEMCVAQE